MTYVYWIELPLAGGEGWYCVCKCHNPENAAEVVRILAKHIEGSDWQLRIRAVPDPTKL